MIAAVMVALAVISGAGTEQPLLPSPAARPVVPLVMATLASGLVRAQAGIIISPDGEILTQLGTLKGAKQIIVTLPGYPPLVARALDRVNWNNNDLLLLRVSPPRPLPVLRFGDSVRIVPGVRITVYGYPLQEALGTPYLAAESGTVTAVNGQRPPTALRTDAPVNGGFGGGPVVNDRGEIVGMLGVYTPVTRRDVWADSGGLIVSLVQQWRQGKLPALSTSALLPRSTIAQQIPSGPGRDIKIAVHVTLSGWGSDVGRAVLDGATLALGDLSQPLLEQGFHVSIYALDDRSDVAVAKDNAARFLVRDPAVLCVIGHSQSGLSMEAASLYQERDLPMISPTSEVANLTENGYRTTFRVIARDDLQGAAAAEFAYRQLGRRTAYVTYEPTDYGLRVASFFWWQARYLGMRVSGLRVLSGDPTAIVSDIARTHPDILYYGGELEPAVGLLRQARSQSLTTPFIGDGGLDSSQFAWQAGSVARGVYYTIPDGPFEFYPGGARFAARFRARFGHNPTPAAALAYDAVGVGLAAITRATKGAGRRPTRSQVLQALRRTVYAGVTGEVAFLPNGDRRHSSTFVMRVRTSDATRWLDNERVATLVVP